MQKQRRGRPVRDPSCTTTALLYRLDTCIACGGSTKAAADARASAQGNGKDRPAYGLHGWKSIELGRFLIFEVELGV